MMRHSLVMMACAAALAATPAAAQDGVSLRADLMTRGYVVQETPEAGELLVFVGDDVVLVETTDDGVAYSAHFPGATDDVVDADAVAAFNAGTRLGEAAFDEEGYLVLRHAHDGPATHDEVVADLEAFADAVARMSLAAGGR